MLGITHGYSYRIKPEVDEGSELVYQVGNLRLLGMVDLRVQGLNMVIL